MLKEERQQHILQLLRQEGKVLATELSRALNISEDTIRRDLNDLAEAGLIQRVHGGALLRSPATASYAIRQHQDATAKAEIAQAALQFVRDGQVIILDGGTTTLQVAQRLPHNLQATIITNSPPIAVALAGHPGVELYLIGGNLYKNSLTTVGVDAVQAFHSFRADLCLLGICSLHPDAGITVTYFEEARTKQAMIASSAEVVALASAEKLNTASPFVVGPITELTHLVTENATPDELLSAYQKLGITVVRE